MKKYCEKEQAVVAALRSDSLYDDLLVHVGNCPFCSEVLLVINYLQEETAFAQDEPNMPDASRIWQRAQCLAREKIVAKATLPIRIVRTFACVAAIFAIPWLILVLLKLPLGMADLGLRYFPLLDRPWSSTLTSTMLFSISVALICIGFSSWYMLREE
jgi:hypothetical protein